MEEHAKIINVFVGQVSKVNGAKMKLVDQPEDVRGTTVNA